jgi:hypothetical protein
MHGKSWVMLAQSHGLDQAKNLARRCLALRGTVFLLKACHLEPMMRSVYNARRLLPCQRSRHWLLRLLLYVGRFDEADAA